nr:DUF3043 domain-containing protein [Corynebacterium lactis]
MENPWKKNNDKSAEAADDIANTSLWQDDATNATEHKHGSAFTPKKGRPTPKRNEIERERGIRRGPVEAPLTSKEARARRKELKASMSKEELKAVKARERAERRQQRRIADERMAAGDPRYLLPRDQGPERKLVRDWVDSRRFLANIFLPFALVLLLVMMIGTSMPKLANAASMIAMVLIVALVLEGIYLGRRAMKLVRSHFPKTSEGAWSIGFYAYSRASQPRRLRTPRPQVNIGDEIK